jgi:hypothetical protein
MIQKDESKFISQLANDLHLLPLNSEYPIAVFRSDSRYLFHCFNLLIKNRGRCSITQPNRKFRISSN